MREKRNCRKCGEHIPNWTKIDGKNKNLGSRKFCLTCSPFRSHNTKPDDPSRPNKKKLSYSHWSEEAKKKSRNCLYKRGHDRKKKLIALSGGKCKKCGYDKNYKVLTFHHIDPSKKNFGLSMNNLWSKTWEVIMEEFKKCEMYCRNCHMEIEDEINLKNPNHYQNQFGF